MEKRHAIVNGIRLETQDAARFEGKIELELRDDSVNYLWTLRSPKGEFLGMKGKVVSFRTIPEDEDRFEFALKHAIESINRTRYVRKKAFKVEGYSWEK